MRRGSDFPMETNLDKKSKKLDKHLDRGGVCSEKPSKTELEILHLLTEEFLTPRRIAIRRQTSRQAVSEIIMKLKKKGLINQYFKKLDKSLSTCQVVKVKGNLVRLHGQEFHINILYKDERYKEVLQRSNIIEVDSLLDYLDEKGK
jgi:DNA-binding MarR family transcriptional regulator